VRCCWHWHWNITTAAKAAKANRIGIAARCPFGPWLGLGYYGLICVFIAVGQVRLGAAGLGLGFGPSLGSGQQYRTDT